MIVYERGEIALRVTTIDDDGICHSEYRKMSLV